MFKHLNTPYPFTSKKKASSSHLYDHAVNFYLYDHGVDTKHNVIYYLNHIKNCPISDTENEYVSLILNTLHVFDSKDTEYIEKWQELIIELDKQNLSFRYLSLYARLYFNEFGKYLPLSNADGFVGFGFNFDDYSGMPITKIKNLEKMSCIYTVNCVDALSHASSINILNTIKYKTVKDAELYLKNFMLDIDVLNVLTRREVLNTFLEMDKDRPVAFIGIVDKYLHYLEKNVVFDDVSKLKYLLLLDSIKYSVSERMQLEDGPRREDTFKSIFEKISNLYEQHQLSDIAHIYKSLTAVVDFSNTDEITLLFENIPFIVTIDTISYGDLPTL